MKKKFIIFIILVIGIGICVFSGYKILVINREYSASAELYSKQEELYVKKVEAEEKQNKNDIVDFVSLQKLNPDICGWIEIPQIKMSYPILQGENNNTYLRHLPDGTYNVGGSIFIDERCGNDFTSPVTVIYGHYMHNGSMFGRLKKFLDASFMQKNSNFKIYTPDRVIEAQIISCFEVDKKSDIYALPENEITKEYIKAISDASGMDFGSIDTKNYNIVLLSTCSHSFESARTVVAAIYKK